MKNILIVALIAIFSVSCAHQGQNTYNAAEVGKAAKIEFGKVIAVRQVEITGENNRIGAAGGGIAGGIAGSTLGKGAGSSLAAVGGAIAGGLIGNAVEQEITDRKGVEYTVTKDNGETITVVQNIQEGERILAEGEKVMIQVQGQFQRVLPAGDLQQKAKKAKKSAKK